MKRKSLWILGIVLLLLLGFMLYVLLMPEPEMDFAALTSADIAQIQLYPGIYENPNTYLVTLSQEDTETVLSLIKQIDSNAEFQYANAGDDNPVWAYQFRLTFADNSILSIGAGGTSYCLGGTKFYEAGEKERGLIQQICETYDTLCVKYHVERFGDFNLDFSSLTTSNVDEILIYPKGNTAAPLPLSAEDRKTLLQKLNQVVLGSRVLPESMPGFQQDHVKKFRISLQDGMVFDFAASGQWYYINGTEQVYYSEADTGLINEISRLYYQLDEAYFGS